jgi:ribulose-5-phosphate 4-epimerase/fuculose-1-phosphate aldolase
MSDNLDESRIALRTELAATLRVFSRFGFQYGGAGHLTARDPGPDELYWVNPLAVPFSLTKASDIVLVNAAGDVVDGKHTVAGFQSQLTIHRSRPDLPAAVHVHSPYGFAWSSAGRILDPLTTDSAAIHTLLAYRDGFDVPVQQALGQSARILIQRGHGFIAAGATIAEAAFYLVAAERAAKTQLLLEAAGRAGTIDRDTIQKWTISPAGAARGFGIWIEEELARDPALAE